MRKLTIIGAAAEDLRSLVTDLAGVVECDFKPIAATLGTVPGEFTLIDIDLNDGTHLGQLKGWIARKPSGAKVVFVTDRSHLEMMQAHALGGTDFIHRPFDARKLLAKLAGDTPATPAEDAPLVPQAPQADGFGAAINGLESAFDSAASGRPIDAAMIQSAAGAVVDEIERIGLATWVDTVRAHHSQTYQHCLLVTGVAVAFASRLGLSRADRERLSFAGMLHDIGKARIPVAILEKPTPLDVAEMMEMRNHPQYGFEMLNDPRVVSAEMLDMVVHHHEYLDGSGYPHGLRAPEISDLVRMITISDIFGALIERRAYKPPFTGAASYKILRDMGGKLDQDLVREFEFASKFDQHHFKAAT
ncbi:MAG: HD domain-containing protein [Pseudolabrys sp.]|nr:HD domain-containing protein [Pseudolabrys sp.]